MQDTFGAGTRPPSGGYITVGTLVLAAFSAVVLVLMAGCHSPTAASGFVSPPADAAAGSRLKQADTVTPLQPFEQDIVVVRPE